MLPEYYQIKLRLGQILEYTQYFDFFDNRALRNKLLKQYQSKLMPTSLDQMHPVFTSGISVEY